MAQHAKPSNSKVQQRDAVQGCSEFPESQCTHVANTGAEPVEERLTTRLKDRKLVELETAPRAM
jgi:hypothetical protein